MFLTCSQIRIWQYNFNNFEIKNLANRSRGLVHAFAFKKSILFTGGGSKSTKFYSLKLNISLN